MSSSWIPLGMSAEDLEALHEGVPPWMDQPLWIWIMSATYPRVSEIARQYDRATRKMDPIAPKIGPFSLEDVITDEDEILRFVDFLVHEGLGASRELDELLEGSGSAWRVGRRAGFAGLERRVAEGVQVAADAVMESGTNAGTLLSEAWHAAFGRSPNASVAYAKSIKAVEEACIPVVLPKSPTATLGTVIATLSQHSDWRLPLTKEHQAAESWDTVLHMCQSLWSGQTDRHGSNNHRPPSQQEAETAVFLAVPLVQWFISGAISRRATP